MCISGNSYILEMSGSNATPNMCCPPYWMREWQFLIAAELAQLSKMTQLSYGYRYDTTGSKLGAQLF